MSGYLTVIVNDASVIGPRLDYVRKRVEMGIKGGPVVITLGRPKKSRELEEKYHCQIADIAKTVEIDGRRYAADVWKALLVDEYEQELRAMGKELRAPSHVVASLDGRRVVTIRPSTTDFSQHEASGFVEFLYKFGAEHGAKFKR